MTEATYQIISGNSGCKVEINRPGEILATAEGFALEADAQSWIAEDKRTAALNGWQKPVPPPHLREV